MKLKKEDIPVTMEAPGTIMRGLPGWEGMTVAFSEMPAGTDLSPLLQGLKVTVASVRIGRYFGR